MSQYFKNFTEEIGEVYVKPCSDDTDKDQFTSHGKLFRNPKTKTYMIKYDDTCHNARSANPHGYIFSHKRIEYYAELEHDC